jgi:signal transduction histidine kinase
MTATDTTAASYRYKTWRVTTGTFYLLVGLAFFVDSLGVLHVTAAELWPLVVIALGVGMLLRRARRLQVEEDRSGQLAVAEERVRIARELHDIVAHGVSLMTIQIAAARRVAASQPDAAQESLAAAEGTGRQTLSELDSMLAVLRGADASIGAAATAGPPPPAAPRPADANTGRTPLPRLAEITELVEGLRSAGATITFDTLGDPPMIPASVQVVVYRVVQEALTNAIRYATDAKITVSLIYAPDTISVFVDDDGPGAAATGRPGGGHGLVGMAERVTTVGGSVTSGPRNPGPGWRVHASIPILAFVP